MSSLGKLGSVALLATLIGLGAPVPTSAQAPAPEAPAAPAQPAPAQPAPAPPSPTQVPDSFGEDVTVAPQTMVFVDGTATLDAAYETFVAAFKKIQAFLKAQGLKASGPAMTIYTQFDDNGFQFRFKAGVPVAEAPKELPADITVGQSPGGKALKFVHRGSYDAMETTYERITHYLDERNLDSQELIIEQYMTDLVSTAEDQLVVEIYVLLK